MTPLSQILSALAIALLSGPLAAQVANGAGVTERADPQGTQMDYRRGATARARLRFDWTHPVVLLRSSEGKEPQVLSLTSALTTAWGEDRRPLLVMREPADDGTTAADLTLLREVAEDERTLLLSKWFRLVLLPPHVTDPGHPLHALFDAAGFAEPLPHFYLLSYPGARPITFTTDATHATLQAAMIAIVRERYRGDPEPALQRWLTLLSQFDRIDERHVLAREQLLAARAAHGPNASRTRRLAARVAELERDRDKLFAIERRIADLRLMPFPTEVARR